MELLKELLQIQHQQILHQISKKLNLSEFEKQEFINKYNKRNNSLVKICNCKIINIRVKNSDLLSNLVCVHNPS